MRYLFPLLAAGVLATPSFPQEASFPYWGNEIPHAQEKTFAYDFDLPISEFDRPKPKDSEINPVLLEGVAKIGFGVFGLSKDGKLCIKIESYSDQCDLFLTPHSVRFPLTDARSKFPVYLSLEVR